MLQSAVQSPIDPKHIRGRKRSHASEESVLAVTAELLSEMQLREISIEEIAKRAGVGKATIYRWWPTKAHVALDAFMKRMRQEVNVPDTGSVKEDVIKQLRSVIRFYTSPDGSIIKQFLAEGQSDPDFRQVFLSKFLQSRRKETSLMWERGLSRGELDPSIDIDVAMDLVYGPVMFRIMTGHAPLDDKEAEAIVDAALHGMAAKQFKQKRDNEKEW